MCCIGLIFLLGNGRIDGVKKEKSYKILRFGMSGKGYIRKWGTEKVMSSTNIIGTVTLYTCKLWLLRMETR